ncbi:hypothetical protein ACHAWF_009978 [Thalassiosira exigua]
MLPSSFANDAEELWVESERADVEADAETKSIASEEPGGDHDDQGGLKLLDRLRTAASPAPSDPVTHKATEIRVLSFARPHMRAFHCSWISFFVSFFVWFAIVPLLPYMAESIGLTKDEVRISNVFNLIPTERLVVGPLCDRYGPRRVFLVLLTAAAIPTACTGFVNTAWGLYILRFFIGMAGGSFVVCQYWSTIMFAPEIVGAANGFIGGWGNLGGGVTQLVIGTGLMPLLLKYTSADKAWRTVSLIPAAMAVVTGAAVYFASDDSPVPVVPEPSERPGPGPEQMTKSFSHHRRSSIRRVETVEMQEATANDAFWSAVKRPATWILFCHYMFSFGVELTMYGIVAELFVDKYEMSQPEASAVASIFGWMNIFARGMGGSLSDWAASKIGMKGRLYTQAICFTLEGLFVLIMGSMEKFAGALTIMIFFSIAVQASEGSTFAIVLTPTAPPRHLPRQGVDLTVLARPVRRERTLRRHEPPRCLQSLPRRVGGTSASDFVIRCIVSSPILRHVVIVLLSPVNDAVQGRENIRLSSFMGAIAIADLIKTTLGPKGMDKTPQRISEHDQGCAGASRSQRALKGRGSEPKSARSTRFVGPSNYLYLRWRKNMNPSQSGGCDSDEIGVDLKQREKLTSHLFHVVRQGRLELEPMQQHVSRTGGAQHASEDQWVESERADVEAKAETKSIASEEHGGDHGDQGGLKLLDCLRTAASPAPSDPATHKATEIRVLSFTLPHIRTFHCSWISFFVSFFVWFAIVPLLPYMIMFDPEIVGSANVFIGGWGRLGGGVTQLVIGTGLVPIFLKYTPADKAWRTVSLIPAAMAVVTGASVYFASNDSPVPVVPASERPDPGPEQVMKSFSHHHRSSIRRVGSVEMQEATANDVF